MDPGTLWHREEVVQLTDSCLACCTYTDFSKCLSKHLWSLILNYTLSTQIPKLYQNYSLA